MRRIWSTWGAAAIAAAMVGVLPAPGRAAGVAAAPPTPGAAEAAVYDPGAHRLLLARDADRPAPVASLVKLMTVRLALQSGKLDRTVTVPPGVTALPETKVGLVPGEQVAMRVLLSALMVRSGNDAAYTIASALGSGEAGFAQAMNAEARRLGLQDTHYVNSSGLDAPGQYSSAADVAKLAGADMALPGFATLVEQTSVSVDGRVYRTVNPFLAFYPGASGIKTGFTSAAMFCLAASAARGGHSLIAVVLGEPSWSAADADAAALLDWGFGAQSPVTPMAPGAAASRAAAPVRATAPPEPVTDAPSSRPATVPAGPSLAAVDNRFGHSGPVLPWMYAGSAAAALATVLTLWLRRR